MKYNIYIIYIYICLQYCISSLSYFLCNGRTIMSTVVHQDECIQSWIPEVEYFKRTESPHHTIEYRVSHTGMHQTYWIKRMWANKAPHNLPSWLNYVLAIIDTFKNISAFKLYTLVIAQPYILRLPTQSSLSTVPCCYQPDDIDLLSPALSLPPH